MKKSLIALAALAAVGAASAQSSVTLYGAVDIGYGSHKTETRNGSGSIKSSGVMDGANAGNRIGFRGTEDLGGGLKANFVVEQGISPTNGSLFGVRSGSAGHQIAGFSAAGVATQVDGSAGSYTVSTNRQSYLGLSNAAMGTVNIGYQYTALYELATLSGYNVGSEGVPGATKAHLHGQYISGMGVRSNMIQYISPNFSGFTARLQYGAGADREKFEAPGVIAGTNGVTLDKVRKGAVMLQYANGPLSVAGAYTYARVQNSAGIDGVSVQQPVFNVFGVQTAAAGATPLTGQERSGKLGQLGASYDFGVAKIAGTYNRGKNGGAANAPTATSPVGTSGFESDYRAYQVGVAVPLGAFVPFATYGRARTDSSNPAGVGPTATAGATGRTEDYRQYQVGLRYSLSKRTTAYVFYGETRNDAASLGGNGVAVVAATATSPAGLGTGGTFYKDRKAIVGVQHSF